MSLTTEKYNEIMREYEQKRIDAKNRLDERTEKLFATYPKLKSISEEISSFSLKSAKTLLLNDDISLSSIKEQLATLIKEKEQMLLELGYDKNYLSMDYECKHCKDTGFVDGEKCSCLKQKIIDALYNQSNIKEQLQKENFNHFKVEYYSENHFDNATETSARQNITEILEISKDFVKNFDSSFENLFIFGETGVGKTFLTNCIAKELIDTAHSVVYMSSIKLFDLLAKEAFNKQQDNDYSFKSNDLLNCDLLVIDDLGTEMINSFTTSSFFNLINERFLNRKSVIISSNLSLGQLRDMYSERVFSRIASNYKLMKIFGKDLRLSF
ncbi:MAG: ATP-binding protein [Lachnospiraceae bacterium]|nr:ATP-binding protein [Lachnospiraceae bacterium]